MTNNFKRLAVAALVAVLGIGSGAGCSSGSAERIVPPPTPAVLTDTDKCPAACARMEKLPTAPKSTQVGCLAAGDLPDGTTCAQLCVEVQKMGVWLNPTCVLDPARVRTCADIEPVCAEGKPPAELRRCNARHRVVRWSHAHPPR